MSKGSEKKKNRRVAPRTLKGFQDLLPVQMIARNEVIDRIRAVYEKYGFVPVDTPVLEYLDALVGAGSDQTNKEMFRLETPEEEAAAMRFDLTVPFARLLAQYPEEMKPPVRRYHIGPVFRADKPGPGRFRQFVQLDIDVAGSNSPAVDAEVIAVACDVMKTLGVDDFRILVNNRKLVDALLEACGVSDVAVQKHVLRVIDKLAKVGMDNVERELGKGRIDDSGDPIPGVGLDPDTISQILFFITLGESNANETLPGEASAPSDGKMTRKQTIPVLENFFRAQGFDTELMRGAIEEMRELADALEGLRVAERHAVFDPSLARGLDYYTGPVFEMVLPGAPEFGSVGAGGRYDGLVSRFLPTPIPATGWSVGLDRLLAALRHVGVVEPRRTITQALIVTMRGVPSREYFQIASELREAGISAEVYFGRRKDGVSQQLSYADAKSIPVAVIAGEDELAAGQVSIKDLREGKEARADIEDREQYREAGKTGQVTVARGEMIETVRAMAGAR